MAMDQHVDRFSMRKSDNYADFANNLLLFLGISLNANGVQVMIMLCGVVRSAYHKLLKSPRTLSSSYRTHTFRHPVLSLSRH